MVLKHSLKQGAQTYFRSPILIMENICNRAVRSSWIAEWAELYVWYLTGRKEVGHADGEAETASPSVTQGPTSSCKLGRIYILFSSCLLSLPLSASMSHSLLLSLPSVLLPPGIQLGGWGNGRSTAGLGAKRCMPSLWLCSLPVVVYSASLFAQMLFLVYF